MWRRSEDRRSGDRRSGDRRSGDRRSGPGQRNGRTGRGAGSDKPPTPTQHLKSPCISGISMGQQGAAARHMPRKWACCATAAIGGHGEPPPPSSRLHCEWPLLPKDHRAGQRQNTGKQRRGLHQLWAPDTGNPPPGSSTTYTSTSRQGRNHVRATRGSFVVPACCGPRPSKGHPRREPKHQPALTQAATGAPRAPAVARRQLAP